MDVCEVEWGAVGLDVSQSGYTVGDGFETICWHLCRRYCKEAHGLRFRAATMNFPVASTLMIKPTESGSKHEIDRFISAMKVIRAKIEKGMLPADDHPLVNAPILIIY